MPRIMRLPADERCASLKNVNCWQDWSASRLERKLSGLTDSISAVRPCFEWQRQSHPTNVNYHKNEKVKTFI